MPFPLTVILVILGVLLALCAVLLLIYLLILVRPAARKPQNAALLTDYAHRGLHGDGVPENSLAAFRLACEAGYGIELDVQLSRDGTVMVFHDESLLRVTGCDRMLSACSDDFLATLSLFGTEEHIPTLREVLTLVGGRVPLLIELKGESFDTSLCAPLVAILKDYTGPYCIESFNPLLLKEMRTLLPDCYRGLLYTNVVRDKKRASLLNIAVTLMAVNFLARPNFIAYNEADRHSLPVRLATGLYRAPRFSWTVRGKKAIAAAKANGEAPIFEQPNAD